MHFSLAFVAVLVAGLASASPVDLDKVNKRTLGLLKDSQLLNFGLSLEFMHKKFYEEGMQKYKKEFPPKYYQKLQEMQKEEEQHITWLQVSIKESGGQPYHEAQYNFPYKNSKEFVAMGTVLEGMTVSAYLGMAPYFDNKKYIAGCQKIIASESRHSTFMRQSIEQSPFTGSFDAELSPQQVYTMHSTFVKEWPKQDEALPFQSHPPLVIAQNTFAEGGRSSAIVFEGAAKYYKGGELPYAAFIYGGKTQFVQCQKFGEHLQVSAMPPNLNGQVFITLNKNNYDYSDKYTIAGPAVIDVGPAPAPYSNQGQLQLVSSQSYKNYKQGGSSASFGIGGSLSAGVKGGLSAGFGGGISAGLGAGLSIGGGAGLRVGGGAGLSVGAGAGLKIGRREAAKLRRRQITAEQRAAAEVEEEADNAEEESNTVLKRQITAEDRATAEAEEDTETDHDAELARRQVTATDRAAAEAEEDAETDHDAELARRQATTADRAAAEAEEDAETDHDAELARRQITAEDRAAAEAEEEAEEAGLTRRQITAEDRAAAEAEEEADNAEEASNTVLKRQVTAEDRAAAEAEEDTETDHDAELARRQVDYAARKEAEAEEEAQSGD